MERCPICGSTTCGNARRLQALVQQRRYEEAEELRERLTPGGMPDGLRELLEMGPEGVMDLIESALSGLSGMLPMSPGRSQTLLLLDENGHATTLRQGTRVTKTLLRDFPNVPEELTELLEQQASLADEVKALNEEINELREQLAQLRRDRGRHESENRYAVWDALLGVDEDDDHYGERGLKLVEKSGSILVVNERDETIATLSEEIGRTLYEAQENIKAEVGSMAELEVKISRLTRRSSHKQEHVIAVHADCDELFRQHISDVIAQQEEDAIAVKLRKNKEGEFEIEVLRFIDEETEGIGKEEQALLQAIGALSAKNGDGHLDSLPAPLRQLMGLPASESPAQLEEPPSETVGTATSTEDPSASVNE